MNQFTRLCLPVSAKEALESQLYHDSVKWYNSQFETLQNELYQIARQQERKLHQVVKNTSQWFVFFYNEVTSLLQREPFASSFKSIQQYSEEARDTQHEWMMLAYEEAYKEMSELFQGVETLQDLLQLIAQHTYLQNSHINVYVDATNDYYALLQDYRKLHQQYMTEYERVDAQYKKIYNNSIAKAVCKIQNTQDDYFVERIQYLNELQKACALLFAMIQRTEQQLVQDIHRFQCNLMNSVNKRLKRLQSQRAQLHIQHMQQRQQLQWSVEKLEEFRCLTEAQTFMQDVFSPYLHRIHRPSFPHMIDSIKQTIEMICDIQLHQKIAYVSVPIISQLNHDTMIDVAEKYPLHALTLSASHIQSDMPSVPDTI